MSPTVLPPDPDLEQKIETRCAVIPGDYEGMPLAYSDYRCRTLPGVASWQCEWMPPWQ